MCLDWESLSGLNAACRSADLMGLAIQVNQTFVVVPQCFQRLGVVDEIPRSDIQAFVTFLC